MQLVRPAVAIDPRAFGRGILRDLGEPPTRRAAAGIADDLKLFAITFLAGFVFVSILIG
ncbi:MAG TPA: hypothetical protein VFG41_07790 [Sphingomicrobium sp.]|jgi:hypothetical protein|nr:hypothetical protein [Sphingomicrobium sp.]